MAHAHGKIILLGEHAVVYGVPALAAGLARGATATARASDVPRLSLGDRTLTLKGPAQSDEARAFEALLGVFDSPSLDVRATLEITPGVGLGASAAIAVACAKAVFETLHPDQPLDHDLIIDGARAWEGVFHGAPSGIDAAAALHGGCLRFTKTDGARPLSLKVPLHIAVAIAGPAASTRTMVEQVRTQRDEKPDVVQKTLDGIESLVENAVHCIGAGDVSGLGELMNYNQMLLAGLFLSTPEIENACRLAREAGALGAKLTGAGGGGAVIALATAGTISSIVTAWKTAGIDCFDTVVE